MKLPLGKMVVGVSMALAVLVATGCQTTGAIAKPAVGPHTDYPCGVRGVSCGHHMCCDEYSDCGGTVEFVGCPAGECCYNGEDGVGFARRANTKQFEEK